jgi:putative MFS transporter
MIQLSGTLSDRQAIWAFALGCIGVTAGVLLHIPMFVEAYEMGMGFELAGMPMDTGMLIGMFTIIFGVIVAAYGLLPRNLAAQREAAGSIDIVAPEDVPLSAAHWRLLAVLVVALIIDVMKPATLGFTVPGMVSEYGVPKSVASLVPFSALCGTVTGSVVWGVIADIYGRKATILLSAVMFVGTSICGAMPSLNWNIVMCFLMGLAAGGMLPVTYALLAEMMPNKHRGWALVMVGGLGAAGGYFAASGFSALFQPIFGWRILWLLNLPTGLILIFLGRFIPESAKFLIARGRHLEAERTMRRFGSKARKHVDAAVEAIATAAGVPVDTGYTAKLVALSVAALAWGMVNFGLLLWLPADLVAKGRSVGASSALLAASALIAFPTIFLAAVLYAKWSTKWSLTTMMAVTIVGLLGVLNMEITDGSPVLPVALLIIGTNGIIAILLPYAAETFPLRVRGKATGIVAACTKGGGFLAQILSIAAMVPPMEVVSGVIVLPAAIGLGLIAWYGRETKGRDLREMDVA